MAELRGAAREHARRGVLGSAVAPSSLVARRLSDRQRSPASEIDAVRHWFTPAVIAAAEERAEVLGVGADEVLIANRQLSEVTLMHALADVQGLDCIDLDEVPATACPLNQKRLLLANKAGLLPLRFGAELRWVAAFKGLRLRHLIAQVEQFPALRDRLLLASPHQLRGFVERHASAAIAFTASEHLRATAPERSAATPEWRIGL